MLRLKLISLFLMLTMVITMLPLSSIGNALSSNEWTEEIPHGGAGPEKAEMYPLHPHFLPTVSYSIVSHFSENKVLIYIHTSESIPSNHSTDVVSPPPDVMV